MRHPRHGCTTNSLEYRARRSTIPTGTEATAAQPKSYYSANATIETDYSLGNLTGDLTKGVPSNVKTVPGKPQPQDYYNTRLLPFQTGRLDSLSMLRMGGCAGCHGDAASAGLDFSFALGNNVLQPEATDAFKGANLLRNYFPLH